MCFASGSTSSTPQTSPQETAAIEAQTAYRKQQINRVNAYNAAYTDVVGGLISKNANENKPTAALKKLMGA